MEKVWLLLGRGAGVDAESVIGSHPRSDFCNSYTLNVLHSYSCCYNPAPCIGYNRVHIGSS